MRVNSNHSGTRRACLRTGLLWVLLPLALALWAGCSGTPRHQPPALPLPPLRITLCEKPAADSDALNLRAARKRTAYLETELERLSVDLRRAEEILVESESASSEAQGLADAVSALAEARIAVKRAGENANWQRDRVHEAREKLKEAERQLGAGNAGSAAFLASRALGIAESLNDEVRMVAAAPEVSFVSAERVNLRGAPSLQGEVLSVLSHATPVFPERRAHRWILVHTASGRVGWVHDSLVEER